MPRDKGIQNLVDFMVADIISMTDEEIIAESTPEEMEQARQAFARTLEAAMVEAMIGGYPKKQRPTALRLRGNGYETVELDDAGNVIEPLRCTCGGMIVIHGPKCPFYCLTV